MNSGGKKIQILSNMLSDKIALVLRIGIFGTYLGHGIFAIEGKTRFVEMIQSMIPVDSATATSLLFVIGIVDVIVAFWVLLKPNKYLLIYAIVWAFMTAVARVTAGDPIWDFVERTPNWTVSLALLLYIKAKAKLKEATIT